MDHEVSFRMEGKDNKKSDRHYCIVCHKQIKSNQLWLAVPIINEPDKLTCISCIRKARDKFRKERQEECSRCILTDYCTRKTINTVDGHCWAKNKDKQSILDGIKNLEDEQPGANVIV